MRASSLCREMILTIAALVAGLLIHDGDTLHVLTGILVAGGAPLLRLGICRAIMAAERRGIRYGASEPNHSQVAPSHTPPNGRVYEDVGQVH